MVGPLVPQIVSRPLMQVVVDQRSELRQGRLIALAPIDQESGYFQPHSAAIVSQKKCAALIEPVTDLRIKKQNDDDGIQRKEVKK